MFENFLFVRGVWEFAGEVLAWEVQKFVHVQPPFGAISYIVHNAIVSDEFACAAFACIAA